MKYTFILTYHLRPKCWIYQSWQYTKWSWWQLHTHSIML